MTVTKNNPQIDAHTYSTVSTELLRIIVMYGDTYASRNAITLTIDQIVNDARLATPVVTLKVPTAAYPVGHA